MRYTIKKGDTLSELAKRHGLTVDDLLRVNPKITNRDLIYEGEDMTVPMSGKDKDDLANTISDFWDRVTGRDDKKKGTEEA